MNLETGNILHGFEITKVKNVPDFNADMIFFRHEKTGAQVIWMTREDENKTFCIGFKTTPENDTGVFHITEHSVLNGSRKYPVREPFVDLLKTSMQTFLNAMTYSDKTLYLVSSRNDKDFMNLVDVYLDGVFHPAIYTNKNIFYQEGWHYEIRKEEDTPVFKGVVLNEMKGAFGAMDEILVDEINRTLFPDNCYQYVSGGDPEHITDLSYEDFIATHQKYYHPSNARVYLDGKIQIDAMLEELDSYFSEYEKEEVNFDIPYQNRVPSVTKEVTYEISEDESLENKTQISFAKIICNYDEVEVQAAWNILASLLVSTNESPLKKALLDAGLAQDVDVDLMDEIQQPVLIITARNTEKANECEIRRVITECINELVESGLDHDQIHATLNNMEFQYREAKEPAGIMLATTSYKGWLYGGEPDLFLDGSIYESLHAKTDNGYFEEVLKAGANLDECIEVIAVPSTTKAAERLARENEKLILAKQSWGSNIEKYIAENKALDEWQATEDSDEDKAKLPQLEISDVDPLPAPFNADKVLNVLGTEVLVHKVNTNGILYMNFYFNMAGITLDHLSDVSLLSDLLLNLPTKKHSVLELQQRIRSELGSLVFSTEVLAMHNDASRSLPLFTVSVSCLEKNAQIAVDTVLEVLKETVFTKEEILPLLKQNREQGRQALLSSGHGFAMLRAGAHLSSDASAREALGGFTSYQKLCDLIDHYDERIDGVIEELQMYQEILFTAARLTASVSSEKYVDSVQDVIEHLNHGEFNRNSVVHYPLLEEKREGIIIPSQVSYSARAVAVDGAYDATSRAMAHILTYEYLWNEVRVKGGAYGTGLNVNPNGLISAWSYRDPSIAETLKTFENIPAHTMELASSDISLTSYIIGAISSGDPLLSPKSTIKTTDLMYLRGMTYEERKKNRAQLLHTTTEDLKRNAQRMIDAADTAVVVVIGNEESIDACGEMKKYSI